MSKLDLSGVSAHVLDGATKGFPPTHHALRLDNIATKQWNILRHDVPFPAAVLKDSALRHNSQQMRQFLDAMGASLCPHGKTTMSPQLFKRQLNDGAWGLTAATIAHVNVYRSIGVKRVFFANQLVGRQDIAYIVNELRSDPDFQFYCLVDSIRHIELLAEALAARPVGRPINVLIEVGVQDGRCGVRTVDQGMEIAKYLGKRRKIFNLAGIEAFEGTVAGNWSVKAAAADLLLQRVVTLAEACEREKLFGGRDLLLTAGGSTHFGRVVDIFKCARLSRSPTILLRSGCYLAHDPEKAETAIRDHIQAAFQAYNWN